MMFITTILCAAITLVCVISGFVFANLLGYAYQNRNSLTRFAQGLVWIGIIGIGIFLGTKDVVLANFGTVFIVIGFVARCAMEYVLSVEARYRHQEDLLGS